MADQVLAHHGRDHRRQDDSPLFDAGRREVEEAAQRRCVEHEDEQRQQQRAKDGRQHGSHADAVPRHSLEADHLHHVEQAHDPDHERDERLRVL